MVKWVTRTPVWSVSNNDFRDIEVIIEEWEPGVVSSRFCGSHAPDTFISTVFIAVFF